MLAFSAAVVQCKLNGLFKLSKNLRSRTLLLAASHHLRCSSLLTNGNHKPKVLLETIGNKGLITLNRPEALNAFNLEMLRQVTSTLEQWDEEHNKVLIIIRGSGGKAFCAGGDMRSIVESVMKSTISKETGIDLGKDMFREAFQLHHLTSTLKTPYIALIDGITMGGGVGISVHGYYRVSTEKTLLAMPETAIGYLPDAGGTYFLPRLKGKLGLFLGLTGYRLKGADVFHTGISTHAVNSQEVNLLQEELLSHKIHSPVDIEACLAKFTKSATFLQEQPFSLEPHLALIDHCFSASSVEEIASRLESSSDPFAKKTLATLMKMAPLSLKITMRALEEGSEMTLAECLQMEYRLSQRFVHDNDFPEGVRALLIDKDQKPKWKPERLEDCTAQQIQAYFEPLNQEDELKL